MKLKSDDGSCDARTLVRTGLLPAAMMPTPPNVSSTSFLLYNPGTERAHTVFRIAGNVGDGMLIRNLTTGQRCKIVNLTDESLLPSAHLELDSRMGQTRMDSQQEIEKRFAEAMGDMLIDGYWSNTAYVPGQEELLYYEALGVMERLAKPTVTYTVDVQNLSGVSGYEQERFTLDTALRIWDETLE